MAVKPKIRTLTNNSVAVLNAIRNSATVNYKNYVPVATADPESIRTIGAIIMDSPSLQNEFLNALYNRIGRVIVESKQWDNPWALFKKGVLEFGETIESVFVDMAKPFQYDPAVAENTIFKREIPCYELSEILQIYYPEQRFKNGIFILGWYYRFNFKDC